MGVGVGVGDVLAGKYRIERIVGAGGYGRVFAARHLALDQLVAVKVLREHAANSVEVVNRFLREARVVSRMRSEHVSRLLDVGTLPGGGPPFIVLEYLEGEDLQSRLLRSGPLPVNDAVDHVLQACHALAEAHALGVVHRDLKPANLFVTRAVDGTPLTKVLDFGIAKIRAGAVGLPHMSLTKSHHMLGSPEYMSPEQMLAPRTVDARSDIWALGVCLFELMSSRMPFEGENPGDMCLKITQEPAPSLSSVVPAVPRELSAIVERCLAKKAADRFGGVVDLCPLLAPHGSARAATLVREICRIPTGRLIPTV
jgi:eukaryotic-like serine/threonine-protein kinase